MQFALKLYHLVLIYAYTLHLLLDLSISKGESNQGVVGLDNHGLHERNQQIIRW